MSNYIKYWLYLTPSQIKNFGKIYTITLNYENINNKKIYIVFLTKSQINKLEKAMANKKKVDLKFSKTQFSKTLNKVINLNNNKKEKLEDLELKLTNLRERNQEKREKLKALKKRNTSEKLELKLTNLREKNEKKREKLEDIKHKLLSKELTNLRIKNQKKRDKLEALKLKRLVKKQGKVDLTPFIKNTFKKYKEPKPKKKKIMDIINLPQANYI